jgi:putative cardiolipin synthase
VDGQRGFVGSFNLDPRSMQLNTEMGVLFSDAALAGQLRGLFLRSAAAETSYRLYLEDGALRWADDTPQASRVWTWEPEAGRGGARCRRHPLAAHRVPALRCQRPIRRSR